MYRLLRAIRRHLSAAASNTSLTLNEVSCNSLAVRHHFIHGVIKIAADRETDGTEVGVTVADGDVEESAVVGSLLLINTIKCIIREGSKRQGDD